MKITNKKESLKEQANNFVFDWNRFPIDYWWRKKYHIAFGSSRHREMNFIDMLIEYQEELLMNKAITDFDKEREENEEAEENKILGLTDNSEKKVVRVSEQEIDEDFKNLDLNQFNKN